MTERCGGRAGRHDLRGYDIVMTSWHWREGERTSDSESDSECGTVSYCKGGVFWRSVGSGDGVYRVITHNNLRPLGAPRPLRARLPTPSLPPSCTACVHLRRSCIWLDLFMSEHRDTKGALGIPPRRPLLRRRENLPAGGPFTDHRMHVRPQSRSGLGCEVRSQSWDRCKRCPRGMSPKWVEVYHK